MISILRIQTNEEFARLGPAWDQLLKQSPVDDAFLTWEWIYTWWKHFGHAYQLCLLTAYEENRLVGIAPLMLETKNVLGFKLRVLRNIGIPAPDVSGMIVQNGREDILEQFALWLVENQSIWEVFLLGEIPPGGMSGEAWTTQFSRRNFTVDVDITRHFYIPMDGDWERYYQGLSKKLRKNLRLQIRHLQAGEGYHYCHKSGPAATLRDIETVFEINLKARHPYLYRDPAQQTYHTDLAQAMAHQGWLDIHFLYVGETPAAFLYGFRYNQACEDWRTGFDSDYAPYSVGNVLLYSIIQDGFEHGIKSFDFLQGDEDSKLNWQVEPRLFSHIRIVRNTPIPLAVYVYFPWFKTHLRNFLSEHETLRPLLKAIERLVNYKQNLTALKVLHS